MSRKEGISEKNIDYYKKILEISTTNDDPLGIASNSDHLGDAYFSLGKYKMAIIYYEKNAEISSQIGDLSGMTRSNIKLGNTYRRLAQYEEAINYYKKSLEISTKIGDASELANSNCGLGAAYQCVGKYREAISFWEKALDISTTIGDQLGIAKNNGNLGSAYKCLGEYRKAIDYYKKGLEISTGIGDRSGIASNNCNLGNAYLSLGEYDEAIKYSKKSLEISIAIDNQLIIARSNGILGTAYGYLGQYEKAIDYHKKGLEISTAIGDQQGTASSNNCLGNAYRRLGEYEKAIEFSMKGLEISTAIGDRLGMADNEGNLGNAYCCLGEYKKAIDHYKIGLEINIAVGDRSGIANKNANLGTAYFRLAEYEKAINHYKKGLEISTTIGDQLGIASNLGNLGGAYRRLGENEKAVDFCQKALKISIAISDLSGIARNNNNLGNAYRSLGKYEMAIRSYKKSLEFHTANGDRSGTACANGNLGNVYVSLKEYEKAIEHYKNGLEVSTIIGDRSGMAIKSCNVGNAYLSLGQHEKAIDSYKKSLEISTKIGRLSVIANANCNLGNAYRVLGKYEVASSYLVKSIRLFDRIFLDLVPDENKLSFTNQYFLSHTLSTSCFLSLQRNESALLVCDLGKAKELHCCIEKHKNAVDKRMFDYTRAIWDRIEAREEQIIMEQMQKNFREEKNDTSILVYAFNLEGFLNVWILNDEFMFRKLNASFETIVALSTQFLRRVNVNVTRDSSFYNLDLVTNINDEIIFPLDLPAKNPPPKNDVDNASSYHGNLTDPQILEKLFQLLIHPVKDYVTGNKLIVVPDRQLFFAPFSSLIDENGCFLSHNYSVQITPSLHTLMSSMERSSDSNFGFALFVGNPTNLTMPDLPCAAEEVKCLSKLFQAAPVVGRNATKQVVLQLLSGASIIHIAAHGEPNQGEIILAASSSLTGPCSSVPEPESYLLAQRDIVNISLQSRLVVLCCCHTGQGEISSEGVIGITRAFLAAGARSVLATLWPINDHATKEFMEKFYDELFKETSVCEALRRTMNIFQEHETGEYRSSRIWAPFTIYGEDVMFQKDEIEKIKEKSHQMFSGFVVVP